MKVLAEHRETGLIKPSPRIVLRRFDDVADQLFPGWISFAIRGEPLVAGRRGPAR